MPRVCVSPIWIKVGLLFEPRSQIPFLRASSNSTLFSGTKKTTHTQNATVRGISLRKLRVKNEIANNTVHERKLRGSNVKDRGEDARCREILRSLNLQATETTIYDT